MEITTATAAPVAASGATTWSNGSPTWGGPGARLRMGQAVDATAQLLGLSADALKAAQADGRSLLDVAANRGVGSSSVVRAVTAAIAPSVSSASAAEPGMTARIAERIAAHKRAVAG